MKRITTLLLFGLLGTLFYNCSDEDAMPEGQTFMGFFPLKIEKQKLGLPARRRTLINNSNYKFNTNEKSNSNSTIDLLWANTSSPN